MGDAPAPQVEAHPLEVEYRRLAAGEALPADTLAAVGFGRDVTLPDDPRAIRVGLEPLHGAGLVEVWRGSGSVERGSDGPIRYARDANFLIGVLELDMPADADLAQVTEQAYAGLRRFQAASAYPQLLRMWNYFDAINAGSGDDERYRRFCVGRAEALPGVSAACYPAATAIGRRDGAPRLQVYWLAARARGIALENPRQVSAYRYPRDYGPAAPRFSRAMLAPGPLLLISGTASVVGHRSEHREDVDAQLTETLANLDSVLARAVALDQRVPPRFTPRSALKVYLREDQAAPRIVAALAARLPAGTPLVVLAADICRADLLVEIDATHPASMK